MSSDETHLETRFTRVYATNLWEDGESLSGPGSRRGTLPVLAAEQALEHVIKSYSIRSISDVPCGDLNWIAPFIAKYPQIAYTGYDIVRPLIARNGKTYPDLQCRFVDAVKDILPSADLIFCKDLIIHLDHPDVDRLMRKFAKSRSLYVLATNNFGMGNSDLLEHLHGDSACRYVDIMAPPFNYPQPIWHTDFFGLWRCSDLTKHLCLEDRWQNDA